LKPEIDVLQYSLSFPYRLIELVGIKNTSVECEETLNEMSRKVSHYIKYYYKDEQLSIGQAR